MKSKLSKKLIMNFLNDKAFAKSISSKESFVCGSYRRDESTVGDIDFVTKLSIQDFHDEILSKITKPGLKIETIRQGEKLAQFQLSFNSGKNIVSIQIDVKTVTDEELPFMILGFTGSQYLNITLRHIAKAKGYILNDYGIFDSKTKERVELSNDGYGFKNEASIFNFLGYEYIPTNLRSANSVAEGFTILSNFKLEVKGE